MTHLRLLHEPWIFSLPGNTVQSERVLLDVELKENGAAFDNLIL
jgi:hypothetical protein